MTTAKDVQDAIETCLPAARSDARFTVFFTTLRALAARIEEVAMENAFTATIRSPFLCEACLHHPKTPWAHVIGTPCLAPDGPTVAAPEPAKDGAKAPDGVPEGLEACKWEEATPCSARHATRLGLWDGNLGSWYQQPGNDTTWLRPAAAKTIDADALADMVVEEWNSGMSDGLRNAVRRALASLQGGKR